MARMRQSRPISGHGFQGTVPKNVVRRCSITSARGARVRTTSPQRGNNFSSRLEVYNTSPDCNNANRVCGLGLIKLGVWLVKSGFRCQGDLGTEGEVPHIRTVRCLGREGPPSDLIRGQAYKCNVYTYKCNLYTYV